MEPKRSDARTAVLLMGYGSPAGPEEIPDYLADVLHRAPSPEMVDEYRRRYALIGGSPQRRVLASLRGQLERLLAEEGRPLPVYLAVKHWKPNVAEAVPRIVNDGFDRIVAVPLSPYASTWILEPYRATLDSGRRTATRPVAIELRSAWNEAPSWIAYWARAIRAARERDAAAPPFVLLSAHSLPDRYAKQGDPYPTLLRTTSDAIARAAALDRWEFTFQSAGNTTEPWLGPDITERIEAARRRGDASVLVASFGFVFDHLETLYDLDHVVRSFAEERGVGYRRVPMANDAPEVVRALADVVGRPPGPELPPIRSAHRER